MRRANRSAKPSVAAVLAPRLTSCLLVLCGLIQGAGDANAQQAKPPAMPDAMRFCGPAHCATLTWNNGKYDAVYDNQATATYTVELFTPESVRFILRDKGGGTAVLTGRISPQGDRIVDGKITWTSGATGTFPFTMTWGMAIATASRPALASPLAPGRQGEMTVGNVPLKLHACETNAASKVERCGTWTWTADKFVVTWNDKNVETVAIDRWTPGDVAFHMVGDTGTDGLLQTCTGKRTDDGTFGGDTITTWSGHWPDSPFGPGISKGTWTAKIVPTESPSYQRCSSGSSTRATIPDPRGQAEASFRAGDVVSGACWARVAAMRGDADSQAAYGFQLLRGLGLPTDVSESFRWTQKAAQQGQIDAQLRLAQMYEDGVGVGADASQAQYWRKAHTRAVFTSILALAKPDNESTLVAAINACEQDPDDAHEFYGQCRRAYTNHINMLRLSGATRPGVEACREEYTLTHEVSRQCIVLRERIAAERTGAISQCLDHQNFAARNPKSYDSCASDYDSGHENLLSQLP